MLLFRKFLGVVIIQWILNYVLDMEGWVSG